ncbi:hypothetical protein [Streptomyces sp. NPDC018693]|uniref:hypothetical protein n=1 Tax=unclassified Streptomyces TaxID=2593676 RepID=UPI0037A1D4A2
MSLSCPLRPGRPARTLLVVALLATATAACGDTGGLRGAGATPTATSPARLWPELTPASSPAWSIDEADTETVKGVDVPDDDIRKADPTAIVRAEIAANPGDYDGAQAPYRDTARLMDHCDTDGDDAECPVLRPYYRDLTGDGRPELTLGFRLLPGDAPDLTAIRVYTVEGHRLVRVMAWEDAVSGVELAGRSVIIRSPSDLADYEYRLQWTWDAEEKAMLLTHDEMLRIDGHGHPHSPTPSPSASRG